MIKKSKHNNYQIIIAGGAVVLLAISGVFVATTNSSSQKSASDVHSEIISSLPQGIGGGAYSSGDTTECVNETIVDRRCTVSASILSTDKETSRDKIESYLRDNGWFNTSFPESKKYFTETSPEAVLTATAYTARHLNAPSAKDGAITSRINIVESRELPPADGRSFRDTGFSYSDEKTYQNAKSKQASRYYLITIQTDYYRYLW